MNNTLSIVRATVDDAALMGRLHSESWRGAYRGIIPDDYLAAFTPEKRAEKFRGFLGNPMSEHYYAEVGGDPAGTLCIGKAHDDDLQTGVGEIHALYLLPEFWSRGYGRALMDFAVRRLKTLGYESVSLWVLEDNARARRFYAAYGFVPDGQTEPITLGKELMEMRYRLGQQALHRL